MSAKASEAITPDVVDRLVAAVEAMPARERPNICAAQVVLDHLARWHRHGDRPVTETVEQIAMARRLSARTVRRSLAALAAAELVVPTRRGGHGHGTARVLTFVPETASTSAAADDNGTRAAHGGRSAETNWGRLDMELGPHRPELGPRSADGTDARTDDYVTDVGGARLHDAPPRTRMPRANRRHEGGGPTAAPKATTKGDDIRQRADAIVRPWWERQEPRPTQPLVAVVKVCEAALRNGWTDAELAAALDDVPTVSGGSLDFWRRKRNGKRSPDATVDGALAVVAAIQQQREGLR